MIHSGRARSLRRHLRGGPRAVRPERDAAPSQPEPAVTDEAEFVICDLTISTKARQVYPEAFCQPIRPYSVMSWRWRSRCVGAVSAVWLGTAPERGGTITAAAGWRAATSA